MSSPNSLKIFVQSVVNQVTDPRSPRGISHNFDTILSLVFLGLLANLSTLAEIERWGKIHFDQLSQFLRFRKPSIPHAITLARVLAKLSLQDLQNAFAEFINVILMQQTLVAAVDGKAAKQMKDENDNPILMLNVFTQKVKLHLASWSIKGDKTNEPGCLKNHLKYLFAMYPCLKLLTGDAIFAQRPLLAAIQEYHRDYLVQVKENQPRVLEQMKLIFKDATPQNSSNQKVDKKRGRLRFAICG